MGLGPKTYFTEFIMAFVMMIVLDDTAHAPK
jgi:hypothetical protein